MHLGESPLNQVLAKNRLVVLCCTALVVQGQSSSTLGLRAVADPWYSSRAALFQLADHLTESTTRDFLDKSIYYVNNVVN